ncbi:alpha/beta hydrolase [Rhizobium sp. Root482]|uniref:alpha/beta hydrolase n=1 Tax=Rhizobium sp. Root482 TaxID=1736543 RepID=UPI0007007B0B|nr:alpha/beta hydrolase [Rhizobium sp. Root482]KQY11547.1 lipase [Rhizobium sp. Root482]
MTEPDLYRIRDFVPDFDAIAAEFTERSRALTARANVRADIAYGARPRETLDLIFPDNPAPEAPLHIFIHGGYWRSGEKESYRLVAEPVLAAGGVTALIEYDLMPGQRLPTLVNQVRRAVDWLQGHARSFGADPARLTVSGHSAGAHLASFLAATGGEESDPPFLPAVNGLLLVSGIYDLSEIPDSFLRDEAKMTRGEAAAWSPLASNQRQGPSRIIAYGAQETAPFREQAQELEARLRSAENAVELLQVPDLNHMSVVLDLADKEGVLGRKLRELVERQPTRP